MSLTGLRLVATKRPHAEADLGRRIRVMYEGAEYRGRSRTTVWDGELSVDGNTIEAAEMLCNWNLDRGIKETTASTLTWRAVTTGNLGGLDLVLGDGDGGRLSLRTKNVSADIEIKDIGFEDMVFEGGGLDRRIRIYRLPERMSETRLVHRMALPVAATGDTRPFVRVTQEDGHRAWSSPIYLFR